MNIATLDLQAAVRRILVHGPDRVVINAEGESHHRSRFQGLTPRPEMNPAIIFIRYDGWSLGACRRLESVAYNLWKKEWAAFLLAGETKPHPIEEYKP